MAKYRILGTKHYATMDFEDGVAEDAIGEEPFLKTFEAIDDEAAKAEFKKIREMHSRQILPYCVDLSLERIDQEFKSTKLVPAGA